MKLLSGAIHNENVSVAGVYVLTCEEKQEPVAECS